jgi:hypothetical protein
MGMSFRSSLVVVMRAKGLFDLAESLGPFRPGLPLPIKNESLAANPAACLTIFGAALAKYLHFSDPLFSLPRWLLMM